MKTVKLTDKRYFLHQQNF